MGVQLFFVLSSYTLCLSLHSRNDESKPLYNFAIRRFFRIAPAYYTALIGYFFLSFIEHYIKAGTWAPTERYTILNTILNIFFIHGFHLPALSLVPGGWSIATEMGFYILFPLLYKYFTSHQNTSMLSVALKWISVFAISQLLLLAIYQFSPFRLNNLGQILYFNLVTQLPVFCIGILYFYVKHIKGLHLNHKIGWVIFLGLNVIVFTFWTPPYQHMYSFLPILSGFSFAILIDLLAKHNFLSPNWLCKIGHYSYGIYLIHFVFASKLAILIAPKLSFLPALVTLCILFISSTFLSYFFAKIEYKIIEAPFLRIGNTFIKK